MNKSGIIERNTNSGERQNTDANFCMLSFVAWRKLARDAPTCLTAKYSERTPHCFIPHVQVCQVSEKETIKTRVEWYPPIQNCTNVASVSESHESRAIPRLHGTGWPPVKVLFLRVHQCIILPGLWDHGHDGLERIWCWCNAVQDYAGLIMLVKFPFMPNSSLFHL